MASDREDRWGGGDEGRDRWDDDRDRGRPPGGNPEAGRSKVKGPAIGLMLVGVISIGLAGWMGVQLANGSMDAEFDKALAEQEKKFDNDPNMTAQQKQEAKDMVASVMRIFRGGMPVLIGVFALSGLVTIVGGWKLMNLSGRGWPMFASILSMIPCCVSYSCVLGIPIGIWTLITLNNPDVKAAFAANAAGGLERDDLDRGRFDDERG